MAYNAQQLTTQLQEQLGVYIYLVDRPGQQDSVYAQAISLMNELEEQNLQVAFYSKDDAFAMLEARLPDVIGNLERYGIGNPLPATMYVTFSTREQFETLLDRMEAYQDIITNLEDLQDGMSFEQQEQRVAYIINLATVVTWVMSALVGIMVALVIAFLMYMIYSQVQLFAAQIKVEKLLGATYWFIKQPFLMMAGGVFVGWYLLHILYFLALHLYVHQYIVYVFGTTLYEMLLPPQTSEVVLMQVAVLIILIGCMVNIRLHTHLRRA